MSVLRKVNFSNINQNLRYVRVEYANVLEEMKGILDLSNLYFLKIEISSLPSLSFSDKNTHLNTVELLQLNNLKTLEGIDALPSLKNLTLTGLPQIEKLKFSEKNDTLNTLTMRSQAQLKALEGVNYLHKLTYLLVSDMPIKTFSLPEELPKHAKLLIFNMENLETVPNLQLYMEQAQIVSNPRLNLTQIMDK